MNNKYFVGQDATSFKAYAKNPPITQIILATDEGAEDAFYAGTEGYSLTVYCPWATQQMANDLLAKSQGFEYQGFEAGMAALPGEAERGDAVTVNGIYGMIADRTLYFNPGMNSDISAPYEEEVNHEFQYVSPIKQDFDRKIGQVHASLTVDIDNIKLEVEDEINQLSSSIDVKLDSITSRVDGLEGEYTELSVTLDGVTIKDASGQTLIKGSSIDTSTIKANSITADKLLLTGSISFDDLEDGVQNDINDAYSTAAEALQLAQENELPSYIKSTYIDSARIESPTIVAGEFYGNQFNISTERGSDGGSDGSFNLYADGYHMLEIEYYWSTGAIVNFSSPAHAVAEWRFPNTRFYGNIDFSVANVSGLTLSTQAESEIATISARNASTDNKVQLAVSDGALKITVLGAVWILDASGWRKE